MDYDLQVARICTSADRLAKREAILSASRWQDTFGLPLGRAVVSPSSQVRGNRAHAIFDQKESRCFYALFEYTNKTPFVYRCAELNPSGLTDRRLDLAIADFDDGWSLVCFHEDDSFTDGPYYYEAQNKSVENFAP